MVEPDPQRRLILKLAAGVAMRRILPSLSFATGEVVNVMMGVAAEFRQLNMLAEGVIIQHLAHTASSAIDYMGPSMVASHFRWRLESLSSLYTLYSERTLEEIKKSSGFSYRFSSDSWIDHDRLNPDGVLVKNGRVTHQMILAEIMQTLDELFDLNDRLEKESVVVDNLYDRGTFFKSLGVLDKATSSMAWPWSFDDSIRTDFAGLSEREKVEIMLGTHMVGSARANPRGNGCDRYRLFNTSWFNVPAGVVNRESYGAFNGYSGTELPSFDILAQEEDPNLSIEEFELRGRNLRNALNAFFVKRAFTKSMKARMQSDLSAECETVQVSREVRPDIRQPSAQVTAPVNLLRAATIARSGVERIGSAIAGALRKTFSATASTIQNPQTSEPGEKPPLALEYQSAETLDFTIERKDEQEVPVQAHIPS
jgi:hypothetical protein